MSDFSRGDMFEGFVQTLAIAGRSRAYSVLDFFCSSSILISHKCRHLRKCYVPSNVNPVLNRFYRILISFYAYTACP
jgi:hypothetical protein